MIRTMYAYMILLHFDAYEMFFKNIILMVIFIYTIVHSCGHQMTKVSQPEEFITATQEIIYRPRKRIRANCVFFFMFSSFSETF